MTNREHVTSGDAPAPIGPYAQAIRAGDTVYCSGQIGIDPSDGKLVCASFEDEVRQALDNLVAVLAAAGASLDRVVKTTIYVTDLATFAELNEIYSQYFGRARPARATVEVSSLPKGARVEIEAIAVL